MTILKMVSILIPVKQGGDDLQEQLELIIEIITQRVLNYCNIRELPPALNFAVAEMVVALHKEFLGEFKIIEGSGKVSSISEDGRTVSFDVSSKIVALTIAADEKISKKTELNKFKQLYLT